MSKKIKELTKYKERRINELNNEYIAKFNEKFGTSYNLSDFHNKRATKEFIEKIMSHETHKSIQFALLGNRVEYKLVSDSTSRLSQYRSHLKEIVISYGDKNAFQKESLVELGKISIVVSSYIKAGKNYTDALRNKRLHLVQESDRSLKLYSELSENSFYDWKENKTVSSIDNIIETYYNIFVSASPDRQGIYHYSILPTADMANIYDKVSNGAYSIALKNLEAEKVMKNLSSEKIEEKLIKTGGYLANMDTESINFGEVSSFAILKGKFSNKIDDLNEKQIELMRLNSSLEEVINLSEKSLEEVLDGNSLMDSFELCFLIWKKFQVLVLPSFFIGKMMQFRPVTIKSAAYITTPDVIKAVINSCTSKYGESFKVIGQNPLFVTDMNGCKLEFDFEKNFDLHVLKIAKPSISGINSQFIRVLDSICEYLDKNIGPDEDGEFRLDYLFEELLPNIFREQLNNIKKSFFNADPRETVTAELIDGYIGELIKISSIADSDINCLKTARKQFLNRLCKDLNKLKLAKGLLVNRKLVPDWTFLITGVDGNTTLEFGEAFTTQDVENNGVLFKWPATGNLERYNYKNNVPQITDPLLKDFFYLCDETSLILPNSKTLMKMLAGLDFDMDTGACCTDRQEEEESNLATLACMINELSRLAPTLAVWRNE